MRNPLDELMRELRRQERRRRRRQRLLDRLDFWEARAKRNPWNDPEFVWTPREENKR